MFKSYFKTQLLILAITLTFASKGYAESDYIEQHVLVSMRMIGHEVLLNANDSTSNVLPIEKEENRYKIQFASEFQFIPAELVATIDSIVKTTAIAKNYLVEVEYCGTSAVVYSFEMGNSEQINLIPCGARIPPRDCYIIYFTILDEPAVDNSLVTQSLSGGSIFMIVLLIILIFGLILLLKRKNRKPEINPDLISIGKYVFNKRNNELLFEDKKLELTSKEAELLLILQEYTNRTIEREIILNTVWGDEGNYVGRTLDVFISKLRKKFEADTNIKIINIRGVGYKLVVNHSD